MVHVLFGRNWIKGELKCKDMSWPVNIENVQNISISMLHLVVLQTFTQKKYFFCYCEFELLWVEPCSNHSLPTKSRKRLAYVAFGTFATHSCSVYDITDTDCWAQNGSVQSCFHNFQTSVFNKQDQKCSKRDFRE